jgi:hypothetical protein
MNCETFTSLMGDYTDRDLDAEMTAWFDDHRRICVDCRRMLDSYGETIRLARVLSCTDIPAAAVTRLRDSLRARLPPLSEYH